MPLINFAGLASGIDSNALIDAVSAASRKQRVTPKEEKIEQLTGTNDALDELRDKLDALKTLAKGVGTLAGGPVAKTVASSNESVATATASNGALNGTYSLTVSQLARNATYSFDYNYTGASDTVASVNDGDPASPDRTFSITIGTSSPETVDIVTTSTMTVGDFIAAFNAASSRAEASLVQVDTGQYRVVITTNNTGDATGSITAVSRGASFSGGKLNTAAATHYAAQNAQFTMSGITGTITRATNKIADVVTGLTFNFASTGTSTITVTDDSDTSASNMSEFVDAYNEIITYLRENNTITREESGQDVTNVFGTLASTRTDESALGSLKDAFSSSVNTGGSLVRILPDIGITTERDGTLKFDEDKFKSALASEPNSVSDLVESLGDRLGLTGGTIDVITRFNGTFDISINSNKTLITSLNDQIAQAEAAIEKTKETTRGQFARLEALIGSLQQKQQALTSALSSLG